jgi:hypothetical protein
VAKLIFLALLAVVDVLYARTVMKGRSLHAKRQHTSITSSNPHRGSAYWFFTSLSAFVLLIEMHARTLGGSVVDPLFRMHLSFAIPLFAASLLLTFWFNGEESRYHRWLAYLSAFLMLGTNATGIPLIILRF